MERQKQKSSFSLSNTFRKFDIFGESVAFKIAGESSVTSCAGAIMTILITVVTLVYAQTRLQVMIDFQDTRFQETEDYRTDLSEVFKQSDTNFNFAIGIRLGDMLDVNQRFVGFTFILEETKDFETVSQEELDYH